MSNRKLNAVIAVEKGTKERVYSAVTELHKQSQKAEPFNAINRTYRKLSEEGEDLPSERNKVKLNAEEVLRQVAALSTEVFDVTAAKDFANCTARADVIVGGTVLVKDAPATYLLFLEKQLTDVRTFVDKLPVLDEAEDWTLDPNSNLYRTAVTTTHRAKKVQKALVLYPATEQHPAQTQLVTEDVIAGYWDTTKLSGAMPVPRKAAILTRVNTLLRAVKEARERANEVEAPEVNTGATVFTYLFA